MPPNLDPVHPYVDSVSMASAKEITLSVEVTDFETTKGAIQISGQATQDSGALATFNEVVDFAKKARHKGDGWFVDVTAKTVPPVKFDPAQKITVFAWVGKAWVTVLGAGAPDGVAPEESANGQSKQWWGQTKESSQLTNKRWPKPADSTAGSGQ
jgi:hypothetical protein